MLARAEEVASPSSVLETEALLLNYALMKQVERVARIELASSVWKTAASPFGQTRIKFGRRSWTRTKEVAWTTVLRTAAIATLPNAELLEPR